MREIIAKAGAELDLGKRGENLATLVTFDVSGWQSSGEGTFTLLHQRNGDKIPYPCVVEVDNGSVYWTVTNADTAVAGRGHAELQYRMGEAVVKSITFVTKIAQAMGSPSEEAPEAAAAWLDTVLQANAEIAQNVEAVAEHAETAAESAEIAAQSASEVKEHAELAQTSAENAAQSEETALAAQEAALAAQEAAEAARDEAQEIAGGKFISSSEKGEAGGVAVLDEEGKIPDANLPKMDYAPASHTEDKDNPHGVTPAQIGAAALGEDGKVLPEQLPDMNAYTKAETLTAATKTALGLGADAVPDDAFEKLSESVYKVGDTRTTVRTDLGDKWLLCNGDEVSAHDYSELAELCPTLISAWTEKELWSSTKSSNDIKCITYANGYWVAGGVYYDGSQPYARIAYTTDLAGEWTIKDLWSNGGNGIMCVTYVDGYWVVGGSYYNSSTYYGRIAYATSLTGTWTTKDLWDGSGNNTTVKCITHADGYWVVGGLDAWGSYYYARIAYTTDLTGEWTEKEMWSSNLSDTYINCITYADGYWVVGGGQRTADRCYARIAYTSNLTSTWIIKDLWNGGSFGSINCITYANGYWVVGGWYDSGSTRYACIAYATEPMSDWAIKVLWSYNGGANRINGIAYSDGYWVVAGDGYDGSENYARIAYTADITSEWIIENLWDNAMNLNCLTYADVYWVVGGRTYSSGYSMRITYAMTAVKLPAISQGTAYTYIKAKE